MHPSELDELRQEVEALKQKLLDSDHLVKNYMDIAARWGTENARLRGELRKLKESA